MTRAMTATRAKVRSGGVRARSGQGRGSKVVDFYRACRQFRRGELKAIGFAGSVRQLRWALTAATFSPDPRGPKAA